MGQGYGSSKDFHAVDGEEDEGQNFGCGQRVMKCFKIALSWREDEEKRLSTYRALEKQNDLILLIPEEFILKILTFLDSSELRLTSSTCSAFKDACNKAAHWRCVELHPKRLPRLFPHVQKFKSSDGIRSLQIAEMDSIVVVAGGDGKFFL